MLSFRGIHSLKWTALPRNILLVKKSHSESSTHAMQQVIEHVRATYGDVNLIVENGVREELAHIQGLHTAENATEAVLASKVDFAITLGGDGTALHTASLFPTGPVPPVLSFSTGTLGFLLPFRKTRDCSTTPHLTSLQMSTHTRAQSMTSSAQTSQ